MWMDWLYSDLLRLIANVGKPELLNDNDALAEALAYGRLDYQAGVISGQTNASIVKWLRRINAVYNPRSNTWTVNSLPPKYSMALAAADARYQRLRASIVQTLDSADIDKAMSDGRLQGTFYDALRDADSALAKTVRSISIPITFSNETAAALSVSWTNNVKLYIKKWSADNITTLRAKVLSNVESGQRFGNLVEMIEANHVVSKNKAKFLARQETSLAVSKLKENRYTEMGITRYQWSTSHDERVRKRHTKLNGKAFSWSDPPIVDEKGNRNHPGEDFNCRCVAIPLLPGQDKVDV